MEKNMRPIANEGNSTKLAICRSKKNNIMARFYSEMEMNGEWDQEFYVILRQVKREVSPRGFCIARTRLRGLSTR
jgi:hypothetical protein